MQKLYRYQYWLIFNYTQKKFQWNLTWKSNVPIHQNAFENIVCQTTAIESRPQYVNRWTKKGSRKSPVTVVIGTYQGSVWSCSEHRQSCIGISPPHESAYSIEPFMVCYWHSYTDVHLTPDFYISELFCASALSPWVRKYDSHPPNIRKWGWNTRFVVRLSVFLDHTWSQCRQVKCWHPLTIWCYWRPTNAVPYGGELS